MSYIVEYDSLNDLYKSVSTQSGNWSTRLDTLEEKVNVLCSTDTISGKAADNMKLYFENIYSFLIMSMKQLAQLHTANACLYHGDYLNLDTKAHAKILVDELDECASTLRTTKKLAESVNGNLGYELGNIKDIFYVAYKDSTDVSVRHHVTINDVQNLIDSICDIESKHSANDFIETSDLIAKIKAFVSELHGQSRSYKSTFTKDGLGKSQAAKDLYKVCVKANDSMKGKIEKLEEAQNLQQVYEENVKESREWIKWVAVGVAVVGSVALIVVTAGGAAPGVCAVVGAASGFAGTAANKFADNYIETGSLTEGMNWSEFARDSLASAAAGAITGYLGATSMGSAIKQPIQKAGMSAIQSISSTGIEGAVKTGWDVGEAIIQKKPGDEIVSILKKGTMETVEDMVVDGAKGFVGGYVSGKFDVNKSDKGFLRKYGEEVLEGTAESVTENVLQTGIDIGKAVTDPTNEKDFKTIFKEETQEMVEDIAKDTASNAVESVVSTGYDSFKDTKAGKKFDDFDKHDIADTVVDTVAGGAGDFAGGYAKQGVEVAFGKREDVDFKEIWEEDMDSGRNMAKNAAEGFAETYADEKYEDRKTQIDLERKDYNHDGKVEVVEVGNRVFLKEDYDAATQNAGKGAYKDKSVQEILGIPETKGVSSDDVKVRSVKVEDLDELGYKTKRKTDAMKIEYKDEPAKKK